MSTDPAIVVPQQSGGAHSGVLEQHHPNHLAVNRLGLWLFLLSESFLFAALITSRYFLQRLHRPEELNQLLGLALTFVLVTSSLSAYMAEMFAARGDQKRFLWSLRATIVLGVLFLVGVGFEWNEAFQHFGPETGFGTIFFTMTGVHSFHVITGLIALAVVYGLGRNGRFTGGNYWAVEGTVKYWHFVDVAWIFIFPTLYLVN
jgi:cytochrome c oxidase subunit 3